MSNFKLTAKNKSTGEVVGVYALDDYFGRHKYGYRPENSQQIFDEESFWNHFEEVVD